MDVAIAWILFFIKLILAMLIVGIPIVIIIVLIARYIYGKFIGPLYEKYEKDKKD